MTSSCESKVPVLCPKCKSGTLLQNNGSSYWVCDHCFERLECPQCGARSSLKLLDKSLGFECQACINRWTWSQDPELPCSYCGGDDESCPYCGLDDIRVACPRCDGVDIVAAASPDNFVCRTCYLEFPIDVGESQWKDIEDKVVHPSKPSIIVDPDELTRLSHSLFGKMPACPKCNSVISVAKEPGGWCHCAACRHQWDTNSSRTIKIPTSVRSSVPNKDIKIWAGKPRDLCGKCSTGLVSSSNNQCNNCGYRSCPKCLSPYDDLTQKSGQCLICRVREESDIESRSQDMYEMIDCPSCGCQEFIQAAIIKHKCYECGQWHSVDKSLLHKGESQPSNRLQDDILSPEEMVEFRRYKEKKNELSAFAADLLEQLSELQDALTGCSNPDRPFTELENSAQEINEILEYIQTPEFDSLEDDDFVLTDRDSYSGLGDIDSIIDFYSKTPQVRYNEVTIEEITDVEEATEVGYVTLRI